MSADSCKIARDNKALLAQELKPQATLKLQPTLANRRTQLADSPLKLFQMNFFFSVNEPRLEEGVDAGRMVKKRETSLSGKGSWELLEREDVGRRFRCLLG